MKIIIMGAGISGITIARLLKDDGHDVEIYEKRDHIGGSCYDKEIEPGYLTQIYGAHIFHTDNIGIYHFLKRFTKFIKYKHKVYADTAAGVIPIPFCKASEKIIGKKTDDEIKKLVFDNYSFKQWGRGYSDLPQETRERVKLRREGNNKLYFTDRYQGIPRDGFTALFKAMAKDIKIHYNADGTEYKDQKFDKLIYTGRIDEYFNYKFGELEFRSLDFTFRKHDKIDYAVLNDCTNRQPHTRYYDSSKFYPTRGRYSYLGKEFPKQASREDFPYYPIRDLKNMNIYKEYANEAQRLKNIHFLGRAGEFKYINIDQAIYGAFRLKYGIFTD